MDEQKYLLNIASLIRIFGTFVITYIIKIPLFYKIILIIIIDRIDCMPTYYPHKGPLFSNKIEICKTLYYQKIDKIVDTICYVILLSYLAKYRIFNEKYLKAISLFLIYRIIGIILFCYSKNKNYLVYFPNLFITITMTIATIYHFNILKSYILLLCIIISTLTVIQEYYMHYSK